MPRWLPRVLRRVRALAAEGRVVLTDKARAELDDLGLQRQDFVEILGSISLRDAPARMRSAPGGAWLYVFRPEAAGLRLYVKVAIRGDCVVISCHEDRAEAPEEADGDE